MDCHAAILQLQPAFTEKPSIKAHSIPDSVRGIFQRVDGLVSGNVSNGQSSSAVQRLIEVSSVCCVRIPKCLQRGAVHWCGRCVTFLIC
ncbi:hypothetical protein Nepgr_015468 [Nepenthes gracilis]|uniref:Uncharacterized protein n=1 Tax=Nepenthes gracilis TaxID=150966 RepID=A0AAD3SM49_NEPGR|nr:hypothetical protein Nepgr_015468 [Nepenthes gracilis]